MKDSLKRPPWQIHLSTIIVLTLAGGGLLGLNTVKRIEPISTDITVGNGTDAVAVRAYQIKERCGWPYSAEITTDGYQTKGFSEALRLNTAICLGMLLFAGIAYEFRIRRSERRGDYLSGARITRELGALVLFAVFLDVNLTLYNWQCAAVRGWPLAFEGYYDATAIYNRSDLQALLAAQTNGTARMVADVAIAAATLVGYCLVCRRWMRGKAGEGT